MSVSYRLMVSGQRHILICRITALRFLQGFGHVISFSELTQIETNPKKGDPSAEQALRLRVILYFPG